MIPSDQMLVVIESTVKFLAIAIDDFARSLLFSARPKAIHFNVFSVFEANFDTEFFCGGILQQL